MNDIKNTQHETNEESKFGLGGAILYGVNVVLGTGILLLPRTIFQDLGPASLLAMALCTGLVFLLALCFAEVSGYFTKNGGAYQYARATFGGLTAFNVGILSWFTVTAVWSASASGLSELLAITFPSLRGFEALIGAAVIIALMFMNLTGIKTVKIFTITVTISKMIPMFAVGIIGLFFLKNGIDAGNYSPFLQLSPDMSVSKAFASTAMTVFYAFVGFESLPIIAGEIRNPKKNVPMAILISLILVSVLYVLIIAAAISTLGSELLTSDAPIQDAFAIMVGRWGYWFISVGAIVSLIGLNVGDSTHSPRMLEAVAEDGTLPAIVAYKDKKGTPVVAIIITSLISLLLVISGSFEALVELSVVFYFFQYIPTALSVIVLRRRKYRGEDGDVNTEEQFKVPGGFIIPVLAVAVSLWMIISDSWTHLITAAVGIAIATAVYYLFNKIITPKTDDAVAPTVDEN
ncbi:APC family permease [Jeotgalibaca caeni]|uniref:APC family permease n=1 Tax=Jeotgalibaca caeni TaxID=3028623 RepID=UPI00237E40C5|nr:APC family permease [Jeotgalibaca caeni]MDE1547611.1 APC family permease [Jeotgalibaca caeni]